ncbi:MAG: hypothetical protein H6684_08550 [Deltaproteobacteria bacterium]|nr:hypothetical protein [Anaerolineales bacterium]MCB9488766.1 hypothetical protein [Deltaproteobacteria bacterium]
MTCDELLEAARVAETPDVILLIADNAIALKLIVAWKTVDVQNPDEDQEFSTLRDMWKETTFEWKQWYTNAGLSPHENQRIGQCLIANGIVYPDGTMNQMVQKYINTQIADLVTKTKSGKATRK